MLSWQRTHTAKLHSVKEVTGKPAAVPQRPDHGNNSGSIPLGEQDSLKLFCGEKRITQTTTSAWILTSDPSLARETPKQLGKVSECVRTTPHQRDTGCKAERHVEQLRPLTFSARRRWES